MDFAGLIYTATKGFPREELFGLTMQFRRAATSVAANIAEGASRSSGRDRARFFEIAYGSLNEIVTMLYIAHEQRLVTRDELASMRSNVADMCRMLSGLKRSALSASRGVTD